MSSITSQARNKVFYMASDGIISFNEEFVRLFPDAEATIKNRKPVWIAHGEPVQLTMTAMTAGWKLET